MSNVWAAFLEWLHWLQQIFSQSDLTYIVALIAAITAILPFSKRIFRFVYKNYVEPVQKFFSTFATLPERLESLETKVETQVRELKTLHEKDISEIKKELVPNGGTSMKDVLGKIDKNISNIVQQGNRMEMRQQSILNSVNIPTFETDVSGDCAFANKAYLSLIGRSLEEIKGPSWINIIHPDDRARVREEWDSAVHEKRTFELTYKIVDRERTIYEVTCMASPIAGNGYIGKFESVTPCGPSYSI